MGYNPILGVGSSPKTQPANLSVSETVTQVTTTGAVQYTKRLTITDDLQVQNISATINIDFPPQRQAYFRLYRNGQLIAESSYPDMSVLATGLVFQYESQRNDFLYVGDEIVLETDIAAGVNSGFDHSYVIQVNGLYM